MLKYWLRVSKYPESLPYQLYSMADREGKSILKEAVTSFCQNMRIGHGQNAYLKVFADFECNFDSDNNNQA